ncbi:hypothetical protein [Pseudovibrio sp. Tun.PSC04-5.I4]|uniref:hypothetical protein n=1 Tax=Pseudovibrio sp. Tun.PSC04-5.I4 TaxID=1798213 RepID=UPI00088F206A|nr:hypothetical protein [Pseudovibrio sp. Tun.PSC04-5.I4]SDR16687.1 iron(III) transport system substrate-binding protein [Pseudovibrio sp. Tun.PSC04-5.I4]
MERKSLSWPFLLVILLSFVSSVKAQQSFDNVDIVGTAPLSLVQPLIDRINQNANGFSVDYTQWRESDILATLETSFLGNQAIDIALLPTPDLGVRLANEGSLARLAVLPEEPDRSHWRQEVFSILYDPAVLVVRTEAFGAQKLPVNRRELVVFLNASTNEMRKRVGLVNIGIDSQSYGFAAQDQLRSLLFWQVMRAFGNLNARIFETTGELVEALQSGEIDLAYNVPLSQLTRIDLDGLGVVTMDDYTVAIPWVVVSPPGVHRLYVENTIRLLRESSAQFFPSTLISELTKADTTELNFQRVKLGPELLVFLDPIKKTDILENWFQAVIGQ